MFYRFARMLVSWYFKIVHRYKILGRENIPAGGCVVCANHSDLLDAVYAALSLDSKNPPRFMGKEELFKKPVIGRLFSALGGFPVKRGKNDVDALRTALKLVKAGGRLIIFPQGTRGGAQTQAGAALIAHRANAPVLPIYIPEKKRIFKKLTVVIGEPFSLPGGKMTMAEYKAAAEGIMARIYSLKGGGAPG